MPAAGQVRHEEEEPPLHDAHEEWHCEHVPWPLTTSTKVSLPGHSATQDPEERKGVAALVQLRHWVALGPVHVPHELAHGSQTLDELEYLPTGVHEARQLLWAGSMKGVEVAQLRQSPAVGPRHSEQLEWHATHVSAAADEPPAHV